MSSLYYKEIGQVLQNAREDLRLTLPEASSALHIRAHYLQALESGKLDDLPGSAYTKGYLQSYAIFLYLDKDEILRRFEIVNNDFPEKDLFFPKVFGKNKNPSNSVVLAGVLLVFIIYFLWFFALRPGVAPSYVTPVPSRIASSYLQTSLSISLFNHTCAKNQPGVYPPCYWANVGKAGVNAPLPKRRKAVSVMYSDSRG
ncbi:MAG: helix-turn-helix domain-containing protein [Rickettsiales bacterium]